MKWIETTIIGVILSAMLVIAINTDSLIAYGLFLLLMLGAYLYFSEAMKE